MSLASRNTQDSPATARRGLSTVQRWSIAVVAELIALGACWYYAFIYARPVAEYDQLATHLDKRVTFRGVFDSSDKAYDLVIFDGHPIRFDHVLGGIEWSPKTGEECRVVGLLERDESHLFGIPYQLTQAEYFPLETDSDRIPAN